MNNFKPVKNQDAWVEKRWRPMMGFTYIAICIFDFILGPIGNYIFFFKTSQDYVAWKTLTMSEGGMFHLAMGAILGIAAWTRGQEKVTRYNSPSYYEQPEQTEDRADYRDRLPRKPFDEDRS
ncbi:MAG: hypothetical protein ACYDG4_16120 [Desulfuromonadaceae bacterium]